MFQRRRHPAVRLRGLAQATDERGQILAHFHGGNLAVAGQPVKIEGLVLGQPHPFSFQICRLQIQRLGQPGKLPDTFPL